MTPWQKHSNWPEAIYLLQNKVSRLVDKCVATVNRWWDICNFLPIDDWMILTCWGQNMDATVNHFKNSNISWKGLFDCNWWRSAMENQSVILVSHNHAQDSQSQIYNRKIPRDAQFHEKLEIWLLTINA